MMHKQTLERFRHLSTDGAGPQRTVLPHLTGPEVELYLLLSLHAAEKDSGLLLEQERIPWPHAQQELPLHFGRPPHRTATCHSDATQNQARRSCVWVGLCRCVGNAVSPSRFWAVEAQNHRSGARRVIKQCMGQGGGAPHTVVESVHVHPIEPVVMVSVRPDRRWERRPRCGVCSARSPL